MAEYIGLENFQTKLDFEHISDYPGLNIVITWSINPTNEQKVKLPPQPKKEEKQKYAKFTEDELEQFTREARMIADQNQRLQKNFNLVYESYLNID